jgi:hypothetical protein
MKGNVNPPAKEIRTIIGFNSEKARATRIIKTIKSKVPTLLNVAFSS